MASISPSPNTGVGMRKTRLLLEAARLKSSWAVEQLPASDRPVIVKSAWTPPSEGNLASLTGPLGVMKKGITFVALASCPASIWGLSKGLVPPVAGWAWHWPQDSALNLGPRPSETVSISSKATWPELKY